MIRKLKIELAIKLANRLLGLIEPKPGERGFDVQRSLRMDRLLNFIEGSDYERTNQIAF